MVDRGYNSAFYAFILLLVLPLAFATADQPRLNKKYIPLVAVPGYLGSELSWSGPTYNDCDGSTDPVQWWVSITALVADHTCTATRVGCNYNFNSPYMPYDLFDVSPSAGSNINVYGDTGFDASGKLFGEVYFDAPKSVLTNLGYTPCDNIDLEYCDFDVASWLWPYAPVSYYKSFNGDPKQPLFADIKWRVERMYERTGEKVALLGHSEGGMSITHFLLEQDQEWLDQYIAHGIFVAPAFCTFETISAPVFGLVGSYNLKALGEFTDALADTVAVTKEWPSAYIMWPLDFVYPNDTVVLKRAECITGDYVESWDLGNYSLAIEKYGTPGSLEAYKKVTAYNNRLQWHPRVKAYVYSGSNVKTAYSYEITDNCFSSGFSSASVLTQTDGDGTLPHRCVETYANHWVKNTTFYTNYTDVPNMVHANFIGTNAGVMTWVNRLCKEEPCIGIDHSINNVCEPGFACKNGASNACSKANEYAPGYGNIECLPIPEGFVKVSNSEIKLSTPTKPSDTSHASSHQTTPTKPAGTSHTSSQFTPSNIACAANYYCTKTSSTPCPEGYVSYPNSTSVTDCVACASGEYLVYPLLSCAAPTPGMYLQSNTLYTCPVGYSCDGTTLTPCAFDSYQSQPGQSTCDTIPVGYYPQVENGVNIGTIVCPAGYKCTNGVPTACTGNQYQESIGSSQCSVCPMGSHTNSAHTTCTLCEAGYACNGSPTIVECSYKQIIVDGECSSCSWYQYADTKTNTCVDFWDGFTSSSEGQTACKAGTFCLNGVVTNCTGNTYSAAGASECIHCPNNQVANADHTACSDVSVKSLAINSDQISHKGSNTGLIVGCVLGIVGGLILIGLITRFVKKRNAKSMVTTV